MESDISMVSPPGDKVKCICLWVEINEEVIFVTRVSVPKIQQALHDPKGIKRVQVNQLAKAGIAKNDVLPLL